MRYLVWVMVVCIMCMGLGACKQKPKAETKTQKSVEVLYQEAMDKLDKHQYKDAVELFEQLERDYPYSPWATKGQVMAAYTDYTHEKYDDAITIIDRFVKLHPGHNDVSYMYYLRALSYYEQIADVKRDQKITEEALQSLKDVIARFPESEYARDAKIKMDLVQDHLAGKELEIGRFYLKKGKMIAAINRFRAVVDDFQTTTHVPEALYRLTAAYLTLGVRDEAQKYAAVLGYNYPDSKWYKHSYALLKKSNALPSEEKMPAPNSASWWKRITK